MKRLSLIGSWKRIGVQASLLAGLGIAFVGGAEPTTVEAAPMPCKEEGNCTFKKPLFGIVLDNSSSMNEKFDADSTRWEGAVEAITKAIAYDNGYIAENFILGMVRFGHDPNPGAPGTTIPADTSGLVDGQKLDVPWYDAQGQDKSYIECTNGDAILAALEAAGPPSGGNKVGIGTWTKGAMDFAAAYIASSKADHPEDMGKRAAILLVLTDGAWTDPTGTKQLSPAAQDPKITAGALWGMQAIPTYVVAIGDAQGKAFANELAEAGGTTAAIDAIDPQALIDALTDVIKKIKNDVVNPICTPGLPRIMVLMDASSSMLNINKGTQQAPVGEGGWDQARDALAGNNSIFDVKVNNNEAVENLVHLGLAVFGHNAPEEQKLLVQYGPCRKDNFDWALDPATACDAPGCTDPYGGPPIKWTFKDGSLVEPFFDDKTLNHMPKCDFNNQSPEACIGSGTYTHLGLNLVEDNIAAYKAECLMPNAPQPCSLDTEFINILVTDGKYNSTDAQVQGPLLAMFGDGIKTYVIGFGDAIDKGQLTKMAGWGSNNMKPYFDAGNQDELEASLKEILEQLTFDECCSFNDCAQVPEPSTNEPDPDIVNTDTGNSTGGDESSTGEVTATDPGTTTDNPSDPSATDSGPTSETDSGASDSNSESESATTVPTTTDSPTEATGGSESDSSPTDPSNPTNPTNSSNPTNPSGSSATDGDTEDTGTASETAGQTDDEGCGCAADSAENKGRGLLGTLLTFGLAGFMRRRRRAS